MSRIASKELYKDVTLYNMQWELQALEQAIKDKKEEHEIALIEEYSQLFINEFNEGNNKEKDIKMFIKDIVNSVKQIEREV